MTRERDLFIAALARNLPALSTHAVCELAAKLISEAGRITRHAVNLCNIPDYQERYDKGYERCVKKVRELLLGTGITEIEIGGDPRGACLKIKLLNGVSNCFGSDMFAVPTS